MTTVTTTNTPETETRKRRVEKEERERRIECERFSREEPGNYFCFCGEHLHEEER